MDQRQKWSLFQAEKAEFDTIRQFSSFFDKTHQKATKHAPRKENQTSKNCAKQKNKKILRLPIYKRKIL
ncbi:MAG: hypothetical protein IJQ37_05725 [Clostridia bacterium]|nr:hypothetical protein [Clostridia bacterium]